MLYTYVFNLSWYLNNKENLMCVIYLKISTNKKAIDVNVAKSL